LLYYELSVPQKWASRKTMYRELPQRSIGAELGVLRGDNSKTLLDVVKPKKLYLVDRWRETKNAPKFAKRQRIRYKYTRDRFSGDKRVNIIRESTDDAAAWIANKSLDWVYIDANHWYAAVLMDIQRWAPKVKVGGFIMLHDFSEKVADGGVIEACLYELDCPKYEAIGRTALESEVPSVMFRKKKE